MLARWLISIGLVIVALGLVLWLLGKLGIPFGQLPGDIHIRKNNYNIYIPIVTSITVSIFLTILLNVFYWLFRK